MRDAWRYNADCRLRIEAERLKYTAQIPVVRLSSDREIEEFIDGQLTGGVIAARTRQRRCAEWFLNLGRPERQRVPLQAAVGQMVVARCSAPRRRTTVRQAHLRGISANRSGNPSATMPAYIRRSSRPITAMTSRPSVGRGFVSSLSLIIGPSALSASAP
jgi:hypothetical protein